MRSTRPRTSSRRPGWLAPAPVRHTPLVRAEEPAAQPEPVPVGERALPADAAALTLRSVAAAGEHAATRPAAFPVRAIAFAILATLIIGLPWLVAALADLLPYGRLPHSVLLAAGLYWFVLNAVFVAGMLTCRRPRRPR